jgi:hypothetical protein
MENFNICLGLHNTVASLENLYLHSLESESVVTPCTVLLITFLREMTDLR